MEDKFNEIWSRVVRSNQGENIGADLSPEYMNTQKQQNAGAYARPDFDLKRTLEDFIEDEVSDSAYYAALAGKTSQSAARAVFNRLSADERRHSRQLQTAYFLLTGNSYTPRRPAPLPPRSMLEALRQRYAAEISGAKAYADAALRLRDTDEPELRDMLIAFAADEKRHASEIKRLVESSL